MAVRAPQAVRTRAQPTYRSTAGSLHLQNMPKNEHHRRMAFPMRLPLAIAGMLGNRLYDSRP